ncbi:MAG: nucleoside-diphosphate kinase [Rickettsia endosymbiont of Sergentomyia squamirostris]|uniref:Nucleoside diphosphate kinase n=1 Tax=Candidatus Tisiphia endosymbiont of Sergentomyia squamirostris TaxID=3113639 RepID=A0AAT9G6I7_9RICK
MTQEYTFSMIKPDATRRNIIGKINSYLENNGLKIVAQKMTILTKDQAEHFYAEHKSRTFFSSLIEGIISGPVVLQVLKGENAILQNRKIMGATNPENAELGTIRRDFAENIEANSIHGSDTLESAEREIKLFFTEKEIVE